MLRWLTAGESHGPSLVAILEGLPAHVEVTSADVADGELDYVEEPGVGGLYGARRPESPDDAGPS